MNKNIEVLQEVLDLLEEEKKKFYNLVDQNNFRIEEINSYLRELSKNEEDDFKVFSPRSAENKHRRQIETDTYEKKKYEEENIEYQKKIEYLKLLIGKLNVVVDNLHIEDENIVDFQIGDNLEKNHIAHQIINCVSFITSDPERAKIELTAIAKKMNKNQEILDIVNER